MILPQSYGVVLILLTLSLLCWGSWANTLKIAGKYRFEFYYLDFALGFMLVALICAFTVGNMGYDGFQFFDDVEHAGKRQWLYGILAGVIFNLGNMLLVAAMSVAGMTIAFPAAIGAALIAGSLLSLALTPGVNILMLLAGCALLAASIVAAAVAYNLLGVIRHEQQARAGKAKSTRRPTSVKGIILALIGGLLLGCFTPLLLKGMETEVGLGPYAIGFMFAVGVLGSAVAFSIFFMNLPVQGDPLDPLQFLRVGAREHLLGVLGGIVCGIGAIAALVATSAPAAAHASPGLTSLLLEGFPLLAALYGIFLWKELRDGDSRVQLSAIVMLLLFAGGIALLSVAPAIPQRMTGN